MLGFEDIDRTQIALVGGKGAHLGELWRIDGISVPAGFCVTTVAFERIIAAAPPIDDREAIGALSADIRRASLFTERAMTYRLQNGVDHRKVRMAVVV